MTGKTKLLLCITAIAVIGCLLVGCTANSGSSKAMIRNLGYDVPGGQSYSIDQMLETKNIDKLSLTILDTNIPTAKLSDDGKNIYAGDTSGYIHLGILKNGKSVGESDGFYLFVALSEAEQEEVEDNSGEAFSVIDKYLHDVFFTEENNNEEGRGKFKVIYNTADSYGLEKDMTEKLFAEYVDKFKDAELQGVLGLYVQDPFEPTKENVAGSYHALYKTKDGGKLYLDISGKVNSDSSVSITVKEPARDGGGSQLYDTLLNAFPEYRTYTEIPPDGMDVKIGEEYMLYSRYLPYNETNDTNGLNLKTHSLSYSFVIHMDK